jgi:hypothetical protein
MKVPETVIDAHRGHSLTVRTRSRTWSDPRICTLRGNWRNLSIFRSRMIFFIQGHQRTSSTGLPETVVTPSLQPPPHPVSSPSVSEVVGR